MTGPVCRGSMRRRRSAPLRVAVTAVLRTSAWCQRSRHGPSRDSATARRTKGCLTIVNVGTTTDTLTRASVPDTGRTAIRWDRNCDGTLETLDRLPLAPAGGTGPAEPAAAHPFDPYDVMAFSVRRDVPAGTTIDLTLTFQHAGRIVTAAYVQPKSANIIEPVRRCSAAPSPRTTDR